MTHLIDGQWLPGQGAAFSRHAPGDNELLWQGKAAASADIDAAFAAARDAQKAWAQQGFEARAAVCRRFAEVLQTHAEALATTIAKEVGKPLWEARTEVAAMVGKIGLSISAYQERSGEKTLPQPFGQFALRHRPHGVVAVFGPYNFPGHLPNGHIVPALLAGNTVVFKPSELTPKTAEHTLQLWQAAGLPAGVLNLVQGERPTGEAVAQHAELDGLYFTGSQRTGQILARQMVERPQVILALELGGNNPLVVGKIRDVAAASYEIIQSSFITSGQRCTCARRLIVPTGAAGDVLLAKLLDDVQEIVVGAPLATPQPFMGPVVSAAAAKGLLRARDQLIGMGAKELLPLTQLAAGDAYLSPGIVDVSMLASLPDEEHFGPLLQIQRYRTPDEAVALANATRFGLSAGVFTDDDDEYAFYYQGLRAGIVNRNKPTTGASGAFPFGGVGASGNHRPSAFYAADYCSYPVASTEASTLSLPAQKSPGLR